MNDELTEEEEHFAEYDNEEYKFWNHSYEVCLSELMSEPLYINADNEQDALDAAIDVAEENGWMGLFIDNPTEEDFNTQLSGGNHGLVLSSDNVIIVQKD